MKIKICPICNKVHEGTFGSGKFCSKSCANTRIHSEETKKKISESLSRTMENSSLEEKIERRERNKFYAKIASDAWKEKSIKTLKEENFDNLSFERLRKRVILEQEGKCNKCGISEWFGVKISLELEHKDGNHFNNARENLEAICPNCHSLTDTWRGRNKSHNRNKVSDEDIVDAFIETGNIRQCLLKCGLAAKGDNYGRVKKVLSLRNIEYMHV